MVEYQSPDRSTIVRHRALTTGAGRYTDRLALGAAGRWIIVVRWAGGGGREPAGSPECFVNVPQVKPTLTLSCPSAASYGGSSSFNGNLSVAGRRLVVEYIAPSGAHDEPPGQRRWLLRPARPRRARDLAGVRSLGRRRQRRACALEHLLLLGRLRGDGPLRQLHSERGQEDDRVPGAAAREQRRAGRSLADGDLREHRHRLVDAAHGPDRARTGRTATACRPRRARCSSGTGR